MFEVKRLSDTLNALRAKDFPEEAPAEETLADWVLK